MSNDKPPTMATDVRFGVPVATNGALGLPPLVQTAAEALALIDALPKEKQQLPRWKEARRVVEACLKAPESETRMEIGAAALRRALLAERWLV